MKKLILILMLTINYFAEAQDFEPSQRKFKLNSSELDSTYLSSSLDQFKQNEFLLGWHWGANARISKALLSNQKSFC